MLGICNGFQILLESGLLPGAMRRNRDLRFQCQDVCLRVERTDIPFTARYREAQLLRMPIAHAEGSYAASPESLDELESRRGVLFVTSTPTGSESMRTTSMGPLARSPASVAAAVTWWA